MDLPGVYVLPRDDDLGSSDEVKVFKDEGEDDGCLEGLDGFNASFSEELQASLIFVHSCFHLKDHLISDMLSQMPRDVIECGLNRLYPCAKSLGGFFLKNLVFLQ